MRIEFTGRQTDVPPRLRALAERKLAKLGRALPGATHAHVTLGADRQRQIAEITLHLRKLDLVATQASSEPRSALLGAVEKLERQARRHVGRRRDLKRKRAAPASVAGAAPAPGPREGREVRVIRGRRAAVKPMTVDEAVLQLDAREDRPVVFRDADDEGVKVLYRRSDGHLGLLEHEV
jgi:putative sigma-54 modulation protein